MYARIYRPARTAMQSGKAKFDVWVLEFDQQYAHRVDPLMGWTSSEDTLAGQVRLTFHSKEAAIGYAKGRKIPHQVIEGKQARPVPKAYADNFVTARRAPWTH
ncbi:ETC complex I subunit [Parvularcula oceani]|uniref:ETC complex I subunit n=1 Tax=Parvularcula oceani TaxID=1247963 RepID=UPI0004E0F3FC|nr:ETC complex I subunit [Parvularcula oceani]